MPIVFPKSPRYLILRPESFLAFRPGRLRHLIDGGRSLRIDDWIDGDQVLEGERLTQSAPVVFFGIRGASQELIHRSLQRQLDHPACFGLELLTPLQREEPQRVDDLPLLIHHVVVLQQPLALLEVLQLDPLLGLLDGPGDQTSSDDLALLRPALVHPPGNPVGAEEPHQVVFQREEEDRLPRISLAARAAPKLTVDAA